MSVNPQLPKEDQVIGHLSQISAALSNIAHNVSSEMGPMKTQPIWNPSDEIKEQIKKQKEERRKDAQIEELQKSNKINTIVARVAVLGFVLNAVIGGLQLLFDYLNIRAVSPQ